MPFIFFAFLTVAHSESYRPTGGGSPAAFSEPLARPSLKPYKICSFSFRWAEGENDRLPALAAAPLGLDSTGDPNCTVHASLLGIPAISLPVLQHEALPLGLQIAGF